MSPACKDYRLWEISFPAKKTTISKKAASKKDRSKNDENHL